MVSLSPFGLITTLVAYRNAIFYYVLGGITFLPLCAAVLITHFYLTAPKYSSNKAAEEDDTLHDRQVGDLTEQQKRDALDLAVWNAEAEQSVQDGIDKDAAVGSSTAPAAARRVGPPPQTPKKPHRAGWLVVRRNFQSDTINQHLQNRATLAAAQVKSDKEAEQTEQREKHNSNDQDGPNGHDGAKQSGYMTMMYRGMLNYRNKSGQNRNGSGPATDDANAEKPAANSSSPVIASGSSNGREAFHCILKGPVLFLYSAADPNSPATECHAAIDLRHKRVSIYVAGVGDTMGEPDFDDPAIHGEREAGTEASTSEAEEAQLAKVAAKQARRVRVREGELFVKRNAIRIVSLGMRNNVEGTRFAQWFIFAKSATMLEDWYHALITASSLPDGHDAIFQSANPVGGAFSAHDMANLLANLDQVPDPIPLRWLNAMVGRIFFSIYRTAWLETYIKSKMMKKIARVRTPSYLSNISVQEVDMGRAAPAFSRPMLKSLTADGEASMEVNVHYRGAIRLTISTTLTISLGSRFKQYSVSLVLAVILHSLEGNLLLHIKPPPSNRLWFGFTKLPKMEIDIEPVVSERKVQWSMVKRLLEGRIRELLTESLVVPNMDDVPFFDSRAYDRRGGIWAEMAKAAWQRDRSPDPQSMLEEAQRDKAAGVALAPKSKSTPASMIDVKTDDEDGDDGGDEAIAASTAVDVAGTDGNLRSRRVGTVETDSDARSLSSSAAAAGLTTLLARDKAAGPSGDTRNPQKRRSWFVGKNGSGSKLGMPSPASKLRGKPQSSLAWGSASLDPSSAAFDQSDSGPSAPASRHEQTIEAEEEAEEEEEDDDDGDAAREVDGPSADVSAALTASASDEALPAAKTASPLLEARDGAKDSVEEPTGTSSVPVEGLGQSVPAPTHDTRRPPPPVPQRKGTDTSIINTPPPSVPPPPHRPDLARVNSQSSQRTTSSYSSSPAAQSLASLQRERYASAPRQDEHAGRAGGPSSVALAATWQRAKASMADKESRQAAAKDAKDALKRGWANWSARRSGQPTNSGPPTPTRLPGVTPPNVQETSPHRQDDNQRVPRSRTSSWLASSPEDPVSLGMGFDVHGSLPAPTEMWLDEHRGRVLNTANTASPGDTASSSRASSTSGRKPYREHLAHKKKPSVGDALGSQTSSRRSSVHMAAAVEADSSPYGECATLPSSSSSTSITAWDAPVSDLPAPMPIAKRAEDEASKGTTRRASSITSTSPSTVRRAPSLVAKMGENNKNDTLSSSTGSYNFVPGQAMPVTGLSGFEGNHHADDEHEKGQATAADTSVTDVDATPRKPSFAPSKTSEPIAASPNAQGPEASPMLRQTSPVIGEDASPPAPVSGIKQQPKRANMMAVPGIPSMQKQGPQSFEAPNTQKPNKDDKSGRNASPDIGRGSPSSSSRLGLQGILPRLPSFSPSQRSISPERTASDAGVKRSSDANAASNVLGTAASADALAAPASISKGAEQSTKDLATSVPSEAVKSHEVSSAPPAGAVAALDLEDPASDDLKRFEVPSVADGATHSLGEQAVPPVTTSDDLAGGAEEMTDVQTPSATVESNGLLAQI